MKKIDGLTYLRRVGIEEARWTGRKKLGIGMKKRREKRKSIRIFTASLTKLRREKS